MPSFHLSIRFALALFATAGLAANAPAAPQSRGVHTDNRYGFKIKPPRDWQEVPVQANEQWLVAKYLSEKKYFWTDKDRGWSYEHQPELMVIAFVDEATKKEARKTSEAEGDDRILVDRANGAISLNVVLGSLEDGQ